jgi:hypothetical protein
LVEQEGRRRVRIEPHRGPDLRFGLGHIARREPGVGGIDMAPGIGRIERDRRVEFLECRLVPAARAVDAARDLVGG